MHFFQSLSLLAATVLVSVGATPVASSDMSPVRRQVLEGRATYYDPNGGFGACGNTLQNTDFIVALTAFKAPGGTDRHSLCRRGSAQLKTLTVSYQGKSIVVTVQDLCPGCQGTNGIDLSESAMAALDSNYIFDGVITVNWSFN
ncbi:hypothetical protein DFH06DRAFT_1317756 [Mycena polygramma]|nr:hypothetical protein DFH06DRAFT_1317756 [Mycena polygramma]